jgi:hypothetical protein
LAPAQLEAPIVHPDLAQPHVDSLTFKLPRMMSAALKSRALATGVSTGFLVRELIRAGAPLLDPPLVVNGAVVLPGDQQEPA